MIDFDDHVAALREVGGDDAALADATRIRVRRTLDQDHGIRRQLVSLAAALAILLGGTVSWALVTGNLTKLWTAVRERATITAQQELPPEQPRAAPVVAKAQPQRIVVAQPELPQAPDLPVTPPPAPPAPVVHPPAPRPVEVLYRHAHDLHFHGDDYAAALAAWDAYLAVEPAGRFSVEARYNRALCLVRLGRFIEARAALLPFAHDEVEPVGYRHDEATALVERLAD